MDEKDFFSSYETARDWFIGRQMEWGKRWTNVLHQSFPIPDHPELNIDAFWLEPVKKEKLVVVSTGEHGIEGYVGSTMARLFSEDFLPRLDPENTGVLIIHAINPWGMVHHRKVNEHGVDLNRNFILDGNFADNINPEFERNTWLLSPHRGLGVMELELGWLVAKILWAATTQGVASLTKAALLGQYIDPNTMFYGGSRLEPEAEIVLELARHALKEYDRAVVFDQHTGYGPRYQMSLTVLPNEPLSSTEMQKNFNYPLVYKVNPEEFYAISGDMTEGLATAAKEGGGGKIEFVTAFEFGTFGDGFMERVKSLLVMILESQNFVFPSKNPRTNAIVKKWFDELYFPTDLGWRKKALADGRQAFEGLLRYFGYISA